MAEAEAERLRADLEAKDADMQFLMEQLLSARQEIHEVHLSLFVRLCTLLR